MKCVTFFFFVLQVKFYEKLSGAVRSASSSSVDNSAHTSPRGSRSTSPKVGWRRDELFSLIQLSEG